MLALVLLLLAWAGTAAFTWVAIEARAGRSPGPGSQNLFAIAASIWTLAVIAAIRCVLRYRWRLLALVYATLAIAAPAFALFGGCQALARWWLP